MTNQQVTEQMCLRCEHADQHGWWGAPAGLTHCRGCHRDWSMVSSQAHCSACHQHFSTPRTFDLHVKGARCVPPDTLRTGTGEPRLVPGVGRWGIVWRRASAFPASLKGRPR